MSKTLSELECQRIAAEGGVIESHQKFTRFKYSVPAGWTVKFINNETSVNLGTLFLRGTTPSNRKLLHVGRANLLAKNHAISYEQALVCSRMFRGFEGKIIEAAKALCDNPFMWIDLTHVPEEVVLAHTFNNALLSAIELTRQRSVVKVVQSWWRLDSSLPPPKPVHLGLPLISL